MPRVVPSPEDFERISPLGFYFVVKTISGGFGFPCLVRRGSQPGGHCLLIFYVVIIHTPFRPQLRPLDSEWSPRDGSCGHLWGGNGEVRQANNTDQNISSESSRTYNVNSPLEDCHGFYFKVLCPLCRSAAPPYSAV